MIVHPHFDDSEKTVKPLQCKGFTVFWGFSPFLLSSPTCSVATSGGKPPIRFDGVDGCAGTPYPVAHGNLLQMNTRQGVFSFTETGILEIDGSSAWCGEPFLLFMPPSGADMPWKYPVGA